MRILLATIVLWLTALPTFAADKTDTFDHVMQTRTLRCGYAMWTPVLYKDMKTGQMTGFAYDLINELGKRLNLKIDWAEETGWGTLVEGLPTHRYDAICVGVAATTGRAGVIGFSTPVFYLPVYFVSRADDKRFDRGYAMLDNPAYKIATLEGEAAATFVSQNLPHASVDAIPQTSDYSLLLKEVETKKADVTMVTPETFAAYNHNNPGHLKITDGGRPASILPATFGLPLGDAALKSMVDVAIGEMLNDGTVDRLLDKYETYPGTFLRIAKPYAAPK